MTDFTFTELVNSPHADVISAALGVDAANKLSDKDLGKPLVMASSDNYIIATVGDEIEGFGVSTEAYTVKDGMAFGSVQRNMRKMVQVATTAVVWGDLVVAAASAAIGTADAYPQVKKALGTEAGVFQWRVISIVTGTGVVGDIVLIEKI